MKTNRKPGQLWRINDNEDSKYNYTFYVLMHQVPELGRPVIWKVLYQDKLSEWTEDSMSQDTLISDTGN
jgi:hypothetical protein